MPELTAVCPAAYSTAQISYFLVTAGITLLATTLVQASVWHGYPLRQLGVRPKGRGLFDYLFHYVHDGVGVLGYDPIQGALSPPLRLLCHCAAILVGWGAILPMFGLAFLPNEPRQHPESCYNAPIVPVTVWWGGLVTTIVYLLTLYYLFHVRPGVSHPGGPRPHKLQRVPAWDSSRVWDLSASVLQSHHCVTARRAHDVTEAMFSGTSAALTGEPCGRDIWAVRTAAAAASSTVLSKTNKVDEAVVQTMASGGRPPGFKPHCNPNSADQPYRAQLIRDYMAAGNTPPSLIPASTVQEATRKAVHFYSMLQAEDGHWGGDYGGPHFLLPGLIVVWYCMGQPGKMLSLHDINLMVPHIMAHQQVDGGWGTHIESPSTMFGTTLMYVALRLLGCQAEDPVCVKGHAFLKEHGGAVMTSSWAKFYLCLLGVMHWDGHNSVPPEMWLLPNWFPFHPGRMWCHARMVYLPMGYLYGSRFVYEKAESDPIILALREELYCEPYETIQWDKTRHWVAPMDNYSPIPRIMAFAQIALACYEKWSVFQPFKKFVRKHGLAFCVDYMAAEDLQTNFIDIGPVNKVLNMLSAFIYADRDIAHPTVANHMMRVADYLWVAEDGMKMKGYNGSQCWDTSFAIQSIYEAGLLDEFPETSKKVWSYLERCQILSTEVSRGTPAYKYESAVYRCKYYRHISEGGWPFSTSAHGWPISDCTGEGLKGVLCLLKSNSVKESLAKGELKPISDDRLYKAASILLSYQNEDGGFATYENCRGFGWYESLNPSEVFGDIMIDYSYVECSMAALTALVDFQEVFPMHRADEVRHSIEKGREFLRSLQRVDGSWYGSWACCFCYACWFGVEGLIKCGEARDAESITKACKYLLQHQRANGGWGEDFTSCYDKEYAEDGMKAYGDGGSGVVSTAWALLALSAAQCQNVVAVKRGVQYLKSRQLPCGDWPQEGIAGVFNRACGITYTAYRNVFPIWAMGRCHNVYGTAMDE